MDAFTEAMGFIERAIQRERVRREIHEATRRLDTFKDEEARIEEAKSSVISSDSTIQ